MDHDQTNIGYQGLTTAEAAALHEKGLGNKQPKSPGKSTGQILAGNFFTLFNLLNFLLAAALIAVGSYKNLLFLGVVFSNTLIGTIQELRAKRTIDKLQLLSAPQVEVIRDGAPRSLPAEDVVTGDLIVLHPGNQLCVDGQVISGRGAMNESLLTGESEPVDKQAGDTLLSGSYVVEGTLHAKVTKVGEESYAAKLTLSAKTIKKPHSELMQSLRYIIRVVSAVLIPLGIILFCKQYFILGAPADRAVPATVAAMLGMIPEGLMLLTSVALAVGVVRLGQRKTLVQELYGIETLARVDTLCVDKTGTITKGTMAVEEVIPFPGSSQEAMEESLGAMIATLTDTNATFDALRLRFVKNPGWEAAHSVPFSSARKWSGASFGEKGSYVMGAAEFILGPALPEDMHKAIVAHSTTGKRVLLLCRSDCPMAERELPTCLVPMGLILLSDVLRENIHETLDFFAKQDVTVKVISGDNPYTVASVARQAGLPGAEKAVDATTLDTQEKLAAAAEEYTVFGRVTPEQKKDLVMALKSRGHKVGMMGDGVNDIPALKAADCSIAMAGGSDATRRIAQLTLLDANFAAVPHIVLEGRRVINNITRAASLFLVKTTFSFLLSLLLVFIPAQYPFIPIQMTLISSLAVGIPSFFLALEPNSGRVKGNFLGNVLRNALPGGIVIVLQILCIYAATSLLKIPQGAEDFQLSTMATLVTGFTSLLVLFFTCRPLNYLRMTLLVLMTGAFAGAVIFMGGVFSLVPLTTAQLLFTLGLMAAAVPLMLLLRRLVAKWQPRIRV